LILRKLLNTLYVTSQGAYLSKEGETVLVKVDNHIKLRLPIHTLEGIVCLGNILCSPGLLHLCADRNVTVSFLSSYGKFLARVTGPVSGNVLLRREQFRWADDDGKKIPIARAIVLAKIFNTRKILERAGRDHPTGTCNEELLSRSKMMARILRHVESVDGVDQLRGKEGEAARVYFSVFNYLITTQKEDFTFYERNRRPPLDSVNALLSFIYTILLHDCISALESAGLDPAVGFFHVDRPGRPGLALDIMEELRPILADRLVLSLINRQQVKKKGFRKTESGGVIMDEETRKTVLMAYQKRKMDEINHPFIQEKIQLGNIPYVQSMLLARHIRGDLEGYPPFFWR